MSEESISSAAHILSSIAHDLRSPLNAVIGFSRIMIRGLDGPLSDMQIADLEAVYTNGQMMLDMVNNLIDVGKIEAGTLSPGNSQVYLEPIIEKAIAQLEATLQDKPIQIESQAQDLLISVRADESHIQQTLADMLAVAVHTVEAGTIKLAVEGDRQQATMRVIGYAPEGLTPDTPHLLAAFKSGGRSTEHRIDLFSLKLLAVEKRIGLYGGRFQVKMLSDGEIVLSFQMPTIRPQT